MSIKNSASSDTSGDAESRISLPNPKGATQGPPARVIATLEVQASWGSGPDYSGSIYDPESIVLHAEVPQDYTLPLAAITPTANFRATPVIGANPLAVTFIDMSWYEPTSWYWEFGDGTTSTEQNPNHTYSTLGAYTVTLTATNSGGSDTIVKTELVNLIPLPVASFLSAPNTGGSPLTVTFTDTSENNPTSWFWEFGDGATSTAQHPSYVYYYVSWVPYYSVTLTVTNAAGVSSITKTNLIAALPSNDFYAWGYNNYGQLGNGTFNVITTPTKIGTASWSTLDVGPNTTLGIKTDSTLWAWGQNDDGQLGLGDTGVWREFPTQVGTATDWKIICAGLYNSAGIKHDGTLWTWGRNQWGELGLGDSVNRLIPTQVGTSTDWKAVQSGGYHMIALKQDGTLWSWGLNGSGELGQGDAVNRNVPTQIGTASWLSISCRDGGTSLAIKSDNTLWSWGLNASGQLGLGDTVNRLVPTQVGTSLWDKVSAGYSYVLAIRTNGTLWAWGLNNLYQLGLGNTTNRTSPVQVGSVWWKDISAGRLDTGDTGSGGSHSLGLQDDGTLWTWGYNNMSQLGTGNTTNRTAPQKVGTATYTSVKAGWRHSTALKLVQ